MNLPLAIMLATVAIFSFRRSAFPRWFGWMAIFAAGAQALLWVGTIIPTGPLSPTGWLGFVLYPAFAVWLLPTAILMITKKRRA